MSFFKLRLDVFHFTQFAFEPSKLLLQLEVACLLGKKIFFSLD